MSENVPKKIQNKCQSMCIHEEERSRKKDILAGLFTVYLSLNCSGVLLLSLGQL